MEIAPGITIDDRIHHGTPVLAGTRVPVALVVGSLAGGMTLQEVAQEYGLTGAQVRAALAYAADVVRTTDTFATAAA